MDKQYLSLISDPPPGFAAGTVGKRELLSGAVVLLAPNCESAYALLPDFADRVEGVVLTFGPPSAAHLGPLLWHVSLSREALEQCTGFLSALLEAVTAAGDDRNRTALANIAQDRLRAEHESHLRDYHRVTAALQAQVALVTASEEKLATILDSLDSFIYLKDTVGRYLFANRSLREYWDVDSEDIVGATDAVFYDAGTAAAMRLSDRRVLDEGQTLKSEEVIAAPVTGNTAVFLSTRLPLRGEDGSIYALCGISTEITDRKQMEEQVRQLAFYDALTQLPNRRLLNDRLSQAMAASKRNGRYAALMFMDLDNFKPLNDAHGHGVGDLLLVEAAGRLKKCVREMDTVARFGGDEFVVMVPQLEGDRTEASAQAGVIADKIRTALSQPYVLTIGHGDTETTIEHSCTVSIGVTLFTQPAGGQDDILRWADTAMYQAKEAGRNTIRFYDKEVVTQLP